MDNLLLLTTYSKFLRDCDGPVTGLYHSDGQYFLILRGELTRIVENIQEGLPTVRERFLLPGITYSPHEERIFFGDGDFFYYQSLVVDDMIEIHAPFPFRACAYSATQDKVAILGTVGQVNICDVAPQYNHMVQVGQWSMNDPVPPLENLNWGTAENQFAGFDNTTAVDNIRNATGLPCEDEILQILWRPDGKFFLVAFSEDGKRKFKIFDVNNGIYAENEDIPGLQAPIAWRVTQSMITVACCSDDVWRLVIFETKGFAKNVVDMEEKAPIIQLTWDETGTVLAVHQKGENESYVLLYTVSNFAFELKQKLVFPKEDQISYMFWETARRHRYDLILVTPVKMLHYQYMRRPTTSAVSINGGSTVASINNKTITILDFEDSILPPPHSSVDFGEFTLRLPNAVNRVVFNASRKSFLAVDCRNLCYVYTTEKSPKLVTSENGFTLPVAEDFPMSVHHYMFYDNVITAITIENDVDMMLRFDYSNREIIWHAEARPYISGVLYVKSKYYTKEYTYSAKGEFYVNGEYVSIIPKGICWIESIMSSASREYIFILDYTGALYCNDKLISRKVDSFIVFNQYLMFITSDNTLYSCRLNTLDTILAGQLAGENRKSQCDQRVLEEGAKLVAGVTSKLTAIVQLPRGNLETISTDLLGIDRINYLLDAYNDWERAINEARLRLLNPNILVDTNIERFLGNIKEIIAVMNTQSIIDFLLTLADTNVLNTLSCRHQYVVQVINDKIPRVCKKFIEEMEAISVGTYIEAIMVARVKAYGLEQAVSYIKNVYDASNLDVNKEVQKGLEAIARYWSADEICNLCLRTYDLDFCLFTYYSFKRDPQLTSMLIDNFRNSKSMNELRYKVNHFTGDYRSATIYYTLDVLERGPDANGEIPVRQLIQYAQNHHQLGEVYNIMFDANICISEISKIYGEYLEIMNDKSKAAEVYMLAADYETAFSLNVSIFQWKEALLALEAMNLPSDEEALRKRALADHLGASGLHKAASKIYDELGMYHNAVASMTHGHFYQDASDLANKRNLPELQGMIKEKLVDYVKLLIDLFIINKTDFENYTKRIEKIWGERLEDMLRPPTDAGVDLNSAEYAESLRSGLSLASRSSRASSRSTRKEQRRYIDLKEGGPYEDIAIMRAVHLKVEEVAEMKPEISSLLSTLIYFDLKQDAKELQQVYSDLLNVFKASIEKIWFPGLDDVMENITERVTAARKNFEFMEEKFRDPPTLGSNDWKRPALDFY